MTNSRTCDKYANDAIEKTKEHRK